MKPTDERIKEFWEWCGLEIVTVPHSQYDCQRWYWQKDGVCAFNGRRIPIDLNNLFKYAVPKINFCELTKHDRRDLDGWFAAVRIKGKTGFINHKDPALALFWAIYEVIK